MKFFNTFQSIIYFRQMAFYAVARGRQVGVYDSWSKCEKQVKNFKGAKYKKFPTHEEAEIFIKSANAISNANRNVTQFSPQDIAVALGKNESVPWKSDEPKENDIDFGTEYWPESEENYSKDEGISDTDLLSALAEIEGLQDVTPSTSTSTFAKNKRKAETTTKFDKSKLCKHESKVWEPIGLKTVGSYEFQIDSEGFVIVYTDGSCINNGGANPVAGFGVYFSDDHPLNAANPVRGRVTNNAGEIQASIHAIKIAKDLGIEKLCVSTDSQFLINAITSWIGTWKRKGWRLKNGEPVKNIDDFKELDNLLTDDKIAIKWNYVRAHMGIKGNEMADKLAREGAEAYRQIYLK